MAGVSEGALSTGIGWAAILFKGIFRMVAVFWATVTAVFFLMRLLPGDPAAAMMVQSGASGEEISRLHGQLGLSASLPVQYLRFLESLIRGDLGRSFFTGRSVSALIVEQFPATLRLALAAMVISLVLAAVLGTVAAFHQRSWVDRLVQLTAAVTTAVPVYWSGLVVIWVFAVRLRWLPATGHGGLSHLVLPAFTLGIALSGPMARVLRNSLLEVMGEPYVAVAWSKGLPERLVLWRHVLPNTLPLLVTVAGLQFGFLLSGTVITETVFSRPGLGRLLVDAVLWKDYPLVQGTVIVLALVYVAINTMVDMSYHWADPRLRGRI